MFFLILLDADCSGRMLATLMVVWVTTAMVASILLRWDYMWIVLAIMTLLLFLICGYTAYNVKKAQTRILIEEQRRAAIRTISGLAAAHRRETELARANQLNVDLPPSYTSVVSTQATSTSSRTSLTVDQTGEENKFENPPSYSIVIASLNMQDQNAEGSNESNALPSEVTKKNSSAATTAVAATSASVSLTCLHER